MDTIQTKKNIAILKRVVMSTERLETEFKIERVIEESDKSKVLLVQDADGQRFVVKMSVSIALKREDRMYRCLEEKLSREQLKSNRFMQVIRRSWCMVRSCNPRALIEVDGKKTPNALVSYPLYYYVVCRLSHTLTLIVDEVQSVG